MDVPDPRTTVVRRALLAACLVLAPVVIMIGGLFATGSHEDTGTEAYDQLLADRDQVLTSIWLFGLGTALLIPGAIGIAQLVRGRGSGLLTTGAAMVGIGGLAMTAGSVAFGMSGYLLTESGVSPDTGRQVFEFAFDDTVASLPWFLGMSGLIGFMVVGIALLRVRAIETWKALLLIVAPVVVFAAEGDGWLSLVTNLPLVIALAAVADRVRRVDAEPAVSADLPGQRSGADGTTKRAHA